MTGLLFTIFLACASY